MFVPKTRASSKTVQNHHWKGLSLQSLFPSLSPLMAALRCRLKSPARSGRTMCLLTPVFPFLLDPLSPQSTTPLPPYLLVFATPLPGMPATRPLPPFSPPPSAGGEGGERSHSTARGFCLVFSNQERRGRKEICSGGIT